MAKSGLAFELRNILYKAKRDRLPVTKEGIPMRVGDGQRLIRIEAIPLPNVVEPYYLVLFHETTAPVESTSLTPATDSRKTEAERRVQQLEIELAQAREDMRTITEDQEAANEELQSANEELLSSSEEMQSLNEELETSKEELQSTNEELAVLNRELNSMNEQVTTARNYAEAVITTIYHPMLVLDKNLRVKTANDAFYKTFQVDKWDTEGMLVYDLGNRQWNIPALRTLLEEVLPQKSSFTDFEVTHNFSGIGERVMLLSGLEIKREKVEEHLILLTIQDFTERKKIVERLKASEAEFRQIADSLPAKITNADARGNAYYFNKAWVDYTGYSFAELQNGGWMKAFHPDSIENVAKCWAEAVATNSDFEMEIRLLEKSGDYKWHLNRAVAIKDDAGTVIKWVSAATEINTQKEHKETLERAVASRTAELLAATDTLLHKNEELRRTNSELESFTYVSSHDLQEPLRKIQTFADYFRSHEMEALSDKGKETIQRIETAANRMQTLIKDLLVYAHANKLGVALEKTDLKKIVTEVIGDLADVILEKGASIETHGLCEAYINPFQFRQVLHNLFANSLKFRKVDTPPSISIYCKVSDGKSLADQNPALGSDKLLPNETYCHIAFTDNGIGFEAEYSEKMFEVFQRLNTREQYAGTGIGLAIVKKIIEQHEGAITASSELGHGATFNIYIRA
jgi:two-component system CheB/CheR fusion protein